MSSHKIEAEARSRIEDGERPIRKILFASHSATLTGAPQVLYNIVSNLDRARFEPLVLFPKDGPIIDKFKAADVPTAVIDIGDSCWGKLHIPMIEALCIAKGIELIHANTIHGFPFVMASKKRGIPCLWYIHEMLVSGAGMSYSVDETEFLAAIVLASIIGTVSQACEKEIAKYCDSRGVDAPEIVVIPNGIQLPATYSFFEPKETIQLLSMGNLAPHKGYYVLVDALRILDSAGMRSVSVILGDGDPSYLVRLWRQAEEAGVEDRMHFLSAVLDVGEHIENCDIVVHPSLVENFSLSIAEAMAYGKPVVATDVGGTRELLIDGETGLLVPPEDPEALAKAILTFIENPEFARECGRNARKSIAENFTIETQVNQLQEIYLSALSSKDTLRRPALSDDTAQIYNLISESLISLNEKFHQLDAGFEDASRKIENNHTHLTEYISHLTEHISNVERDIRALEAVLDNLFQKFPFRMYQKIKAFVSKKR